MIPKRQLLRHILLQHYELQLNSLVTGGFWSPPAPFVPIL